MDNVQRETDSTNVDTLLKMYSDVCANIGATDEISFKLLGLVPLISTSLLSWLIKTETKPSVMIAIVYLFGAVITFAIFRWELRNIQACRWFRARAEEIEAQLGFPKRHPTPRVLGWPIGKTEAEKVVYIATLTMWILTALSSIWTLLHR